MTNQESTVEKEKLEGKLIFKSIFFIALIIAITFIGAGRIDWEPRIPILVVIIGVVVYTIGQIIILWAKKVNKFFSTVVRIQKDRGQTVCKDGPYRFVRHPGYLGGLLYIIVTPFVFSSFWGLIPTAIAVVLLFIRTYLEDKTLQRELEGYTDYTNEARYRLLPGIW